MEKLKVILDWFHKSMRYLINKDGGDYSKVNLVNLDVGDIVATLGPIADATWVYENRENEVLKEAGREINYFNLGDIDPVFNFCAPAMFASDRTLKEKPEAVRSFLHVLDRAYREVAAHPAACVLEVREMLPAGLSDDF